MCAAIVRALSIKICRRTLQSKQERREKGWDNDVISNWLEVGGTMGGCLHKQAGVNVRELGCLICLKKRNLHGLVEQLRAEDEGFENMCFIN